MEEVIIVGQKGSIVSFACVLMQNCARELKEMQVVLAEAQEINPAEIVLEFERRYGEIELSGLIKTQLRKHKECCKPFVPKTIGRPNPKTLYGSRKKK